MTNLFRSDHLEYVLGYGSLLSADSRKRHSQLEHQPLPIKLSGWARDWVTRSQGERQTYVGASPDKDKIINGALVPVNGLSPSLRTREQDYEFVLVDIAYIEFLPNTENRDTIRQQLSDKKIWLCETKKRQSASPEYPVYQSYVDTCLAGCLEFGGRLFATEFALQSFERFVGKEIESGSQHWLNDRARPQYPRAAQMAQDIHRVIDSILADTGLLEFRGELPK